MLKPDIILRLRPLCFCCPMCGKEHFLEVESLTSDIGKFYCKCGDTKICLHMKEGEGTFNISRLDEHSYRITSCYNGCGIIVDENANIIRAINQTPKGYNASIMEFEISPLYDPQIFANGSLAQDLEFNVIYIFEFEKA